MSRPTIRTTTLLYSIIASLLVAIVLLAVVTIVPWTLRQQLDNALQQQEHLYAKGIHTAFPLRTTIEELQYTNGGTRIVCTDVKLHLSSNLRTLWRFRQRGRHNAAPVITLADMAQCEIRLVHVPTAPQDNDKTQPVERTSIGTRIQHAYDTLPDKLAGIQRIEIQTVHATIDAHQQQLHMTGGPWFWERMGDGQHAGGEFHFTGAAQSQNMQLRFTARGPKSELEIRPEGVVMVGERVVSFDILHLSDAHLLHIPHINLEDATQNTPHIELTDLRLDVLDFPTLFVQNGRIDFGKTPVVDRLLQLSKSTTSQTSDDPDNVPTLPLTSPADPQEVWSLRLLARARSLIDELHEVLVVKNQQWPVHFDLRNLDIRNERDSLMRVTRLVHTNETPLSLDAQINHAQLALKASSSQGDQWTLSVQQASLSRVSRFFEVGQHIRGQLDADILFGLNDRHLQIDGTVNMRNVIVTHDKISALPVGPVAVTSRFKGTLPAGPDQTVTLDIELGFNGVPIVASLIAKPWEDRIEAIATLGLGARMDCQALWEAIPAGMLPHLAQEPIRFSGNTEPMLTMTYKPGVFESFSLKSTGFPDSCTIALNRSDFSPAILMDPHYVQHVTEGVTRDDIFVGPGVEDYVSIRTLPAYVPAVMYLSEEIDFYKNGAISLGLINKGIRHSLPRKRYAYGGSTVTQQLVKNLFLSRTKTLSRKLEEAMISWAITQDVPKDRVLELYINCIEFGPDLYGIVRASRHYFHKEPDELTPLEATWLATLKPSPSRGERELKRGSTSPHRWLTERIQTLLQRLVDYGGFISQEEVDAAAPYVLHFGAESSKTEQQTSSDVKDL